jgi:predicted CopG family antitoxin
MDNNSFLELKKKESNSGVLKEFFKKRRTAINSSVSPSRKNQVFVSTSMLY